MELEDSFLFEKFARAIDKTDDIEELRASFKALLKVYIQSNRMTDKLIKEFKGFKEM